MSRQLRIQYPEPGITLPRVATSGPRSGPDTPREDSTRQELVRVTYKFAVRGTRQVRRSANHHNLDAILAVGYRVLRAPDACECFSMRPGRGHFDALVDSRHWQLDPGFGKVDDLIG